MRYIPFIFFAISLIRCANIIPPEGGPRDTIPPVLIKSIPANNSTSFQGNQIVLEFDEAIQLRNAKEEIIITPSTGKNTKFLFRKNLVTIIPENKLDSATTYSIAFRESVRDLNEGNPVEALKLAFSTGPIIDSLEIKGTAYAALEGKAVDKFNVAIYSADTFDITKHAPSYISATDKKGRFSITNLKPGQYLIYTWEDKNKNLKVETNNERFGTLPNAINLPEQKDSLRIPIVKVDSRPLKLNNYRNISNYSIIRFNKAPSYFNLRAKDNSKVIYFRGDSKNEIIAYPPKSFPDSVEIVLSASDSIGNKTDSTFYIKQTKSKPLKEEFTYKLNKATYTEPTKLLQCEFIISLPINKINLDSIFIQADSIRISSLLKEDLKYDTINRKVEIEKKLMLPDTLSKKPLFFEIVKSSVISIFSDTLKTGREKIQSRYEKDLATLILTSKSKKEGWIIEVITDKQVIQQSQSHGKQLVFKNLDATNIQIRAIKDENKNGIWDVNNPITRKPPEEVIFYRNETGTTNTPLRANWTVEIEWNF